MSQRLIRVQKVHLARLLLAAISLSLFAAALGAQQPQLALTPPMGWNSWNHFAERVTDADVRGAADALVTSGMRDAGYVYVNIDDTWQGPRDADGNITSNSRFPDMKALADYVHGKGLKLGVYSSPGSKTCVRNERRERIYEGSLGHEQQDAKTYAAWGIDYLKYDLCSFRETMNAAASPEAAAEMMKIAYTKMSTALRATGRPIVFSLCQYGLDAVWTWGPSVGGNLWRTSGDISDKYDRMSEIGFSQAGLAPFAGPGHWNDPDMLEVGNGGMNVEEYRTHMSLWAMLAAPLLAGNDLSHMTPDTRTILLNRDVIAIDQDRLGVQGDRVKATGPIEVWAKPLADGATAVAIFNRLGNDLPADVDFAALHLAGHHARDLWSSSEIKQLPALWNTRVKRHGVILLRVEP